MPNRVGYADIDMDNWELDPGTDEVVLPDVTGWRIMILPFRVKEKTSGGVIKSDETQDRENLVVTLGKVIQTGPLAYKKDMGDPWCKEGDIVVIGKYAGKKLRFRGVDLVIVNDDEILAVLTA